MVGVRSEISLVWVLCAYSIAPMLVMWCAHRSAFRPIIHGRTGPPMWFPDSVPPRPVRFRSEAMPRSEIESFWAMLSVWILGPLLAFCLFWVGVSLIWLLSFLISLPPRVWFSVAGCFAGYLFWLRVRWRVRAVRRWFCLRFWFRWFPPSIPPGLRCSRIGAAGPFPVPRSWSDSERREMWAFCVSVRCGSFRRPSPFTPRFL